MDPKMWTVVGWLRVDVEKFRKWVSEWDKQWAAVAGRG
jgi:hypothetical protein